LDVCGAKKVKGDEGQVTREKSPFFNKQKGPVSPPVLFYSDNGTQFEQTRSVSCNRPKTQRVLQYKSIGAIGSNNGLF
jgi:hypothetical protein